MGVTEDGRSPGAHIINIFVAIDVPHARAFGLMDEERLSAHGAKRAHRRIHAAGDVAQRLGEQRSGFGCASHSNKIPGANVGRESIGILLIFKSEL